MRRQCELLGLSRASLYYQAAPETKENLHLMQLIDREYTAHPFLGSRRLTKWLGEQGVMSDNYSSPAPTIRSPQPARSGDN